jgi:hypothetical protein
MKAERGVSLADENLSIGSPGAATFAPPATILTDRTIH